MSIICSLKKSFTVNHRPAKEKIEVMSCVLGRYNQVHWGKKERPATLLPGHRNFIGYDGQVVPIQFKIFGFLNLPGQRFGITGQKIVDEMKKGGVRQATGYEIALCGSSPEFEQMFFDGEEDLTVLQAITVNDSWKNKNGFWVSCVEMEKAGPKVEKKFRYFYAGDGRSPLKHHFPICDSCHVVVGVKE
jgi:hypothetical protein